MPELSQSRRTDKRNLINDAAVEVFAEKDSIRRGLATSLNAPVLLTVPFICTSKIRKICCCPFSKIMDQLLTGLGDLRARKGL